MAFLRQKSREQPLSLSHPENSPINNCTHRVKARKQCHEMECPEQADLWMWKSALLKFLPIKVRLWTIEAIYSPAQSSVTFLVRSDIFRYYFHILSDIPAWRCVVFLREHRGKFDLSLYLSWGGARQVLSRSCDSRVERCSEPALLCSH